LTLTAGPVDSARRADAGLEALRRGRSDIQFFAHVFLGCRLHDGQLRWMTDAEATVNALATANRYGKTFLIPARHYHRCMYKIGAEDKYTRPDGTVDPVRFRKTKYHTVHTAGDWETASLVFEEAHKLLNENPHLRAMLTGWPRSKPPHIDFASGARWKFRTLGYDASGIDGNSFYYISIDEAGWIADLEEKMRNVIRVRVADVQGIIDIVGTFKPGVSKDFYKICVRASVHTGTEISFDHREDTADEGLGYASGVERYCREYGIALDELADAAAG
jgi:hypothetical protein